MNYIFAEKPSQAKAYADAFTIEKREKTHISRCGDYVGHRSLGGASNAG